MPLLIQQADRCPALQVSLDAEDIRNEKVKVLRSMKMIKMDDVVLGQYRGRKTSHSKLPGYLDDDTVPEGRYVLYSAIHVSAVGSAVSSRHVYYKPQSEQKACCAPDAYRTHQHV